MERYVKISKVSPVRLVVVSCLPDLLHMNPIATSPNGRISRMRPAMTQDGTIARIGTVMAVDWSTLSNESL